ncbi:MAG: hypothetical protein J1F05_08530 [Muribaculaceae bacterium]|nr:hypothetical protein [Muribaculaceae bacterium]
MRFTPIAIACVFLALALACSNNSNNNNIDERLAELLRDTSTFNQYDNNGVTPPDDGCERLKVNWIKGTFGKVFNDSNYIHLYYAQAGGIKSLDENNTWAASKGLIKIESTKDIYIDELTHSYSYLMPHAARLLEDIGQRFNDSLAAHGGGAYRPKVTSVLRTPLTMGKLRRINRNASSESAHGFGTTFDISHSKFICDDSTATRRTFEDLKNLLARIIFDLREEGRCVVKHERKQACFHITAIPDSIPSK